MLLVIMVYFLVFVKLRFVCIDVAFHVIVHDKTVFEQRQEKTNILVSDMVRHKQGCTATEDG